MKRLMILTMLGVLLSGVAGCRFMECLCRGPACQQTTVACPDPCATTYNPCDPCAVTPSITPGPETYAPAPIR